MGRNSKQQIYLSANSLKSEPLLLPRFLFRLQPLLEAAAEALLLELLSLVLCELRSKTVTIVTSLKKRRKGSPSFYFFMKFD